MKAETLNMAKALLTVAVPGANDRAELMRMLTPQPKRPEPVRMAGGERPRATLERHGKMWALHEPDGSLVAVVAYRVGVQRISELLGWELVEGGAA